MRNYILRFKKFIYEAIADFFRYDMYVTDDTPKTLGTKIKK